MRIHKEGYKLLTISLIFLIGVNLVAFRMMDHYPLVIGILSLVIFLLFLQFFRNPDRSIVTTEDGIVYAPADGKVVVIEETEESEYFQDRRIQISIFMSPVNVHVNRNPISGVIDYYKYHPGKYLVAWHPKSSTENERTTVVYNSGSAKILLRQIAGAAAKRIVSYVDQGQQVVQGQDMGFIKFGSRVDLFLPLDADIRVSANQKVKGNRSIIARLS